MRCWRCEHASATELVLRVSVDHHRRELHEEERGRHTWLPTLRGLKWLSNNGFALNVAGRLRWGDAEASMREGFAALFASEGIALNASDPVELVLFPEMDLSRERSGNHHRVLGHSAQATGRRDVRVVADGGATQRRGGADCRVVHVAAVRPGFDLGPRLADALSPIKLNHPHCAKFCVLGGGRCSA